MKIYFINDLHWEFWKKEGYTFDKYWEEFFLPADVCCIAGDIANCYEHEVEILQYLKSRYFKVIYVAGNHDLGVFNRDKYKNDIKNSYVKKNMLAKKIHNQLDGNIIKVNGVTFGGSCGSCDWSWVEKNFPDTDKDFFTLWQDWFDGRWWKMDSSSPVILFNEEYKKLQAVAEQKPNIFVTHFQPLSCPIADSYKNDILTGMFVYDDSNLNLPSGTIYHFGHTHSKLKLEQNGVLYLNNCIGYPEELNIDAFGKFNKEDFLIEVKDKYE